MMNIQKEVTTSVDKQVVLHQRTINEVQENQNLLFDKYAPVQSSSTVLAKSTEGGLINLEMLKKINFVGFDEIKKMLRA